MNFSHLPTWTLINAGETIAGREWIYSDVVSPYMRLYYVLDGEAEVDIEGSLLRLRPGYMYFIPAMMKHSYHCSDHLHHYYLHIAELTYEWNDCLTNVWNMPFELEGTPNMLRCFEQLVKGNPEKTLSHLNPRLYDSTNNINSLIDSDLHIDIPRKLRNNALISWIISNWMDAGYYEDRTHHYGIKDAIIYIFRNHSKSMSLDELATKAGLSVAYFARKFKEHTGHTVTEFINGVRLHRARRTIETTALSMSEVASMSGYDDVNYFIRLFKKKFGITPAAYRRTMRNTVAVHPQSVGNISDKITSDELNARLSSGSNPQ